MFLCPYCVMPMSHVAVYACKIRGRDDIMDGAPYLYGQEGDMESKGEMPGLDVGWSKIT